MIAAAGAAYQRGTQECRAQAAAAAAYQHEVEGAVPPAPGTATTGCVGHCTLNSALESCSICSKHGLVSCPNRALRGSPARCGPLSKLSMARLCCSLMPHCHGPPDSDVFGVLMVVCVALSGGRQARAISILL
jgi:hypothetical protein